MSCLKSVDLEKELLPTGYFKYSKYISFGYVIAHYREYELHPSSREELKHHSTYAVTSRMYEFLKAEGNN